MQEISVVVLTKNSEKLLENCLKSIVKNKPSEIIIIDDGSTDGTLEISRKYTKQIYHNAGGVGSGRQLGAEKANKDLIAYVDSDTVLPEDFFYRMLLVKKEGDYHAVRAHVLSLRNTTYWQWGADQFFRKVDNKPRELSLMNTIASIFDKEVILRHGFDPLFTSGEDSELLYRLIKGGYRLGIASVGVYHLHRESFNDWARQRVWRGEGRALFIYKYKSTIRAIRLFLGLQYMILCSPLLSIKYGQPKLFPYLLLDGLFQEIGMFRKLIQLLLTGKRSSC